MSIRQISVFLENRPGKLYELTGLLARHGIDMRALSIAECWPSPCRTSPAACTICWANSTPPR